MRMWIRLSRAAGVSILFSASSLAVASPVLQVENADAQECPEGIEGRLMEGNTGVLFQACPSNKVCRAWIGRLTGKPLAQCEIGPQKSSFAVAGIAVSSPRPLTEDEKRAVRAAIESTEGQLAKGLIAQLRDHGPGLDSPAVQCLNLLMQAFDSPEQTPAREGSNSRISDGQ